MSGWKFSNYRYSGPGSGCGYCKRRFWPKPTQQRKRIVPIHDHSGGVCNGALTPTVDFTDGTQPLICWHRWGKWITTGRSKDTDTGMIAYVQYRDCNKCGKRKTRYSDE